jgi:hypothetical protein
MSRNYTASTRDRVGDLVTGMRVDTNVIASTTYFDNAQWEIFNVFGRIMILEMYCEVITVQGADAVTLIYNYTSSTPVITIQPLCAISTDVLTSSDVGDRMNFNGGAITNVATLSATECIQDEHCADPHIVGLESGVGTIGIDTAGATGSAGTVQFSIHYIPMSDGAYVTNVL